MSSNRTSQTQRVVVRIPHDLMQTMTAYQAQQTAKLARGTYTRTDVVIEALDQLFRCGEADQRGKIDQAMAPKPALWPMCRVECPLHDGGVVPEALSDQWPMCRVGCTYLATTGGQ